MYNILKLIRVIANITCIFLNTVEIIYQLKYYIWHKILKVMICNTRIIAYINKKFKYIYNVLYNFCKLCNVMMFE